MEDKRNILNKWIIWASLAMLFSVMGLSDIETPQSVKDFYDGMEKLSNAKDDNTAKYICLSMKDCFFASAKSSSGGNLVNDFRFFDYDKKHTHTHNDDSLSTSLYVDRLQDYLYKERVMKMAYRFVGNKDIGEQPEFSKGKLSASVSIIASYVIKVFEINGYEKVFNDTVLTDTSSGKISEISNGLGREKASVNINKLRIEAAIAYRLERYYEAYKKYEEIIAIAPTDADALYRIALMTYYQQGCYYSKKTAHIKGKSYMEKARHTSDYRSPIKEKAVNVLHHWMYPYD